MKKLCKIVHGIYVIRNKRKPLTEELNTFILSLIISATVSFVYNNYTIKIYSI